MLGLRGGGPRAHPRAGARPLEVDRRVAAEVVPRRAGRHRLFVRAPAELGRLHAFRQEAFHRPGVDELAARLGVAGALGVALGDVDALDAGALHQPRPVLAGLRFDEVELELAGDVEQRLLHHPGHHAGIGAAAAHRGDAARAPTAQIQQTFTQRVVRALRDRAVAVGVEARPRLHHGVDVEGVDVLAELHQVDRGGVDRQVDHHAAPRPAGEQGGEHLAVVLLGDRQVHEPDLALVQQVTIAVIGRNDDEFRAVEGDVPLDQRQGALADRPEADHHDRAVETGMQRPVGRAGDGVHVGYSSAERLKSAHAVRGAATGSLPTRPATSAATSGFACGRPRALMSPRAPSSAPALSSRASSRCRS